jgi:hypothetical protein
MIVYADTNFFSNSLLDLAHSPEADALLESLEQTESQYRKASRIKDRHDLPSG